MTQDDMKKAAAIAALDYIEDDMILGVGTGSTTDFFIEQLAKVKNKIDAAVASSIKTQQKLQALGIRVIDLNTAGVIPLYVDGADEANEQLQLIKGGGGALTREKIIAFAARKFVCIIDESKLVKVLGDFPLPIEVIPMARSLVAREIVKMGGSPEYREGFTTDNGNIILNIRQFPILKPFEMEEKINQIPGVVSNGICALRPADVLLVGGSQGVKVMPA